MNNYSFDGGSTRISSSSSGSHHRYNYNNLPKFSGSTQYGNGSPSTSTSPNITTSIQQNERLPFSGSRKQMLSDNPQTRKFSNQYSNTRNSSGYPNRSNYQYSNVRKGSDKASFFRRVSDSISRNFSIESDGVHDEKPLDDVFIEFLSFLKSLLKLIWVLVRKGFVWVLFGLTWCSRLGQKMSQDIPNPNWKALNNIKLRSSINNITNVTNTDGEMDNGLTVQSTQQDIIKSSQPKYPGIARRLEELNNQPKKEKTHIVTKSEPLKPGVDHYGTKFYPMERNLNNVNLENTFLNIANSMTKRDFTPASTHAENIKSSIKQISNLGKPSGRPTFTRSTARFADLDWLKDDNEDYINNLEYTRLFKEYQKIFEERNKMQEMNKIKQLKSKGFTFRPLSLDKVEEIEEAWDHGISGPLITKFGIEMFHHDILTLSDGKWLNDKVIDFYMRLIMDEVNGNNCKDGEQKIHVFSTFFYSTLSKRGYQGVARWAKRAKVDVSKLDYLFVPVNLNQMHWTMAYVDNVNKRFVYVDSLYGTGDDILMSLMDYMTQETMRVHGKEMNGMDYTLYDMDAEAQGPKQQNGFDCGVFTCTAVAALGRKLGFCYSQGDMSFLRRKMAYEILKGKLEN